MTETPGSQLLGLNGRKLVLASTSPRRMELLSALGVRFEVQSVAVDERILPGEDPEAACVRLATAKALAAPVADKNAWVLAADTLVVCGEAILGKPADDAEASRMLRTLSGRLHEVWTGLCLRRMSDGRTSWGAECTRVWFETLSEDVVETLVRSGECHDKAGAYGIQGLAGLFVSRIEGDYYNVMGLPLSRVRRVMREAT